MADKLNPRMQTLYAEKVRPKMVELFGYKKLMEVPKIEKIVLNMGVGEAVNDRKKVESAAGDLALIAGQRPVQPVLVTYIANEETHAVVVGELLGHLPLLHLVARIDDNLARIEPLQRHRDESVTERARAAGNQNG